MPESGCETSGDLLGIYINDITGGRRSKGAQNRNSDIFQKLAFPLLVGKISYGSGSVEVS